MAEWNHPRPGVGNLSHLSLINPFSTSCCGGKCALAFLTAASLLNKFPTSSKFDSFVRKQRKTANHFWLCVSQTRYLLCELLLSFFFFFFFFFTSSSMRYFRHDPPVVLQICEKRKKRKHTRGNPGCSFTCCYQD